MTRGAAKRIEPADLVKITLELARARNTRLRAIVGLAHGAAFDLGDVLGLKVGDVLTKASKLREYPIVVLVRGQRAIISTHRPLLQHYVTEYELDGSEPDAPLFDVPRRTVQYLFAELQRRAGLAAHYCFADLRHDALCAFGDSTCSVSAIQSYGRLRSAKAALRYLPRSNAISARELAKLVDFYQA